MERTSTSTLTAGSGWKNGDLVIQDDPSWTDTASDFRVAYHTPHSHSHSHSASSSGSPGGKGWRHLDAEREGDGDGPKERRAALATSTPIDGGVWTGSPVRGVHFSPLVSEMNWDESDVSQRVGGGARHRADRQNYRHSRDTADESNPLERVKVTTTEGVKPAVQKVVLRTVVEQHAGSTSSPDVSPSLSSQVTPTRTRQQQHQQPQQPRLALGSTKIEPLPTGPSPTSVETADVNENVKGIRDHKDVTNVQNGDKVGVNGNNKRSRRKSSEGHVQTSIWERLGIGRLSFGKGSKNSKSNQTVKAGTPVDNGTSPHPSEAPAKPERSPVHIQKEVPKKREPVEEPVLQKLERVPQKSEPVGAGLPPRPPLPASASKHLSPVIRARLVSAQRKQFLTSAGANTGTKPAPITVEEARQSSENLRQAFERFRQKAQEDRRRLAHSVPDLQQVETTVKNAQTNRKPAGGQAATVPTGATAPAPPNFEKLTSSQQEFQKRWDDVLGRSRLRNYGGHFNRDGSGRATISSNPSGATDFTHPYSSHGLRNQYTTAAQYFVDRSRGKGTPDWVNSEGGKDQVDLETGERLFLEETLLGRAYSGNRPSPPKRSPGATTTSPESMKARSMMNLGDGPENPELPYGPVDEGDPGFSNSSRAKSMEFLLDDANKDKAKPPENSLQKEDRQMSEHELRFQKSLQRLDVPDWYKKSAGKEIPSRGIRRAHHRVLPGGWEETKMSSSSMSSLQSSRATTPTGKGRWSHRPSFDWRYTSSRENLMNPTSSTSSPVPSDAGSFVYPGLHSSGRWSAGPPVLSSNTPKCPSSVPGRRPYLGWRSQEKLRKEQSSTAKNSSEPTSAYSSPAERLAQSLLAQKKLKQETDITTRTGSAEPVAKTYKAVQQDASPMKQQSSTQLTPDTVRDSIKEVTNAIVHYCCESEDPKSGLHSLSPEDDLAAVCVRQPVRRTSPSAAGVGRPSVPRGPVTAGRVLWLESSFVGNRPPTSTSPVSDLWTLLDDGQQKNNLSPSGRIEMRGRELWLH